jgi:hypothetical protein
LPRADLKKRVVETLGALGRENAVAISAINGLGGVGKSVLAVLVARDCEVRRRFRDGIAMLEVGKQPNLIELQARLGALVGLEAKEFTGDLDANRQRLSQAFRDKHMLIILDNVWYRNAVDAVNFGAEGVKFILTTRIVALANHYSAVRVDLLSDREGGELILKRAALPEAQRADCEAISRQLNGLTLAVSIAAAKIENDGLTAVAYLERLKHAENPLSHLTLADPDDPYADANDREANFEESLKVTYSDLLPEMQRRFRALGVFAPDGSFDAAAAAAVWAEPTETAQSKLNVLVNLALAERDAAGRYSQHSLLRAYARALLREAGELQAAAARHAEHYLARMRAADDSQTYYTMRDELPQLRAAFAWAEQTEQPDLAQDILSNTANLLQMLNLGEEYLNWANRLVALVERRGGNLGAALTSRGNACQAAARVVIGEDRRARLLAALADYTTALELRRDVPLAYATTLTNRAVLLRDLAGLEGEDRRARLLAALADYTTALELRRDVPLAYATTLTNRAVLLRDLAGLEGEDRRARLLAALADYTTALELRRDVPLAYATTLNNRANLLRDLAGLEGEDRRARLLAALADSTTALALLRDVPLAYAQTLTNRAVLLRDLAGLEGEDRRARLLAALADSTTALALLRDVPLDYATTLNNRAILLRGLAGLEGEDRRARLLAALADYTTALELRRDVPLAYAQTLNNRAVLLSDLAGLEGEDRRARLLAALADSTTALALLRDVPLDYATTLNNRANLLRDLAGLEGEDRRARLLQALRDAWQAVQLFEQYQHAVYSEIGQRVLRNIKSECGADFEGYWQAAVGQPQPAWLQQVDQMARLQQLAEMLIAWVQTPDWSASRAYLEQHQDELLTDAAEQALQLLIQANPGRDELTQHLEILQRARRDGIAAAYAQRESNQAEMAQLQQLANLIIAWIQTPDWSTSRTYLEEHQDELLTDAAEQALQLLIQANPGRDELTQHLEILQACRAQGIAAAYAPRESNQAETAQLLQQLFESFMNISNSAEMAQFVAQMPAQQLDMLERLLETAILQLSPSVQAVLRQRLEALRQLRRGG